jgi:hypothetical protein
MDVKGSVAWHCGLPQCEDHLEPKGMRRGTVFAAGWQLVTCATVSDCTGMLLGTVCAAGWCSLRGMLLGTVCAAGW